MTELALLAATALVFAPAAVLLARQWSQLEYYSHGFLVPIVSALVAARLLQDGGRVATRTDRRGALLVGAALALYAPSLMLGSAFGAGIAAVAALAGVVWFVRGPAWLRRLAFPLGYLLFMVPIPAEWLAPVTVRLLSFVSQASVGVLGALGLPVAREGNVILLPDGASLFVAEACSGLTSLVTLTPIAVLIAWMAPIPRRAQLLLVALVVPIAMLANLLRVIGTVAGAQALGVGAVTDEPVHTLVGLGVYAVGCLMLVSIARLLAASAPIGSRSSRAAS